MILLSSTRQHIQTKTDKLAQEAGRVGLKVNVDKCKGPFIFYGVGGAGGIWRSVI